MAGFNRIAGGGRKSIAVEIHWDISTRCTNPAHHQTSIHGFRSVEELFVGDGQRQKHKSTRKPNRGIEIECLVMLYGITLFPERDPLLSWEVDVYWLRGQASTEL